MVRHWAALSSFAPAQPKGIMDASAPSTRSVLGLLAKSRVVDLGRHVGVAVPLVATKDEQIGLLVKSGLVTFRSLMGTLGRDELKAACRAHGLDDTGRARQMLAHRLLEAHGAVDSVAPLSLFRANEIPRYAPRPGDIVQVRHRQWLAEDVIPPPAPGHATRVRLVGGS